MARAGGCAYLSRVPADDDRGVIAAFLGEDHARLDALVARALADPARIDEDAWQAFRRGLLQHIAMEEKVLLRAAARGLGQPVPGAERLRREHGFLAQLLTIRPTHALAQELLAVLGPHNAREEGPDGVYARCESALGSGVGDTLARMRALPSVRVAPYRRG